MTCMRTRSQPGAADLDGHHDQRLGAVLTTAPQVAVRPADETLTDLDPTGQRLPLRIDHRAAQLLQEHPGGLVAAAVQLPLQLHRGDPRSSAGHQVRRPEPQLQRRAWAGADLASQRSYGTISTSPARTIVTTTGVTSIAD
jgi:hypothetical protein